MAKLDGTNGLLQQYDYQVLTTGFSYTFAAGTQTLIINPAGTLATGTVTMPAAPADGMVITVESTQIITALTLSGNTGQSIVGVPATLFANQPLSYVYRLSNTTWYPFSVARSAVLQVLASSLTTTVSNNGVAFADTGLTLTITPSSATSKVLIQWAIPNGSDTATASVGFNLVRNGTNIAQGTGGTTNITSSNDSGGSSHAGVNALVFLDSPATTSALTYKVQFKSQSGCTGYINRTNALNGGSDVFQSGFISNLVAMEIAA
jgi:hypothetical protein